MLRNKTIHELRAIAQGFGVEDIFSKDVDQLVQDIELKQTSMIPEPSPLPPKPEYDARLMTKPPSRKSDRMQIEELLSNHVLRGLKLDFPDEETWHMRWDKREDTGSIRMPLRVVLGCANKIMTTGVVRE